MYRIAKSDAAPRLSPGRTCLLALLLSAAVLTDRAAAQRSDRIVLKRGAEIHGRISAQQFDGLIISRGRGASTKVPWDEVEAIDYDAPPGFRNAVSLASAGLDDEAWAAFDVLRADASIRKPLRQESQYQFAVLSLRRGLYDDAVSAYRALLESFPQGRYLVEAARGMVDGLLRTSRADAAVQALDDVASTAAPGSRLESEYNLLYARIWEARQDYGEALRRFQVAEADALLAPVQQLEARLGAARCLQVDGRIPEAEDRYRDLVEQVAPSQVLAGAWNGLGDLALAEGRLNRDEQRITDALFCFMRGVVLYVPRPGDAQTEQDRAIVGAAECFESLSQLATDPRSKARLRLKANELRRRLSVR